MLATVRSAAHQTASQDRFSRFAGLTVVTNSEIRVKLVAMATSLEKSDDGCARKKLQFAENLVKIGPVDPRQLVS